MCGCPAKLIRSLSKEEINGLPLLSYGGEVRLVSDAGGLDAALDLLEDDSILGFDTETRPSFRKGKTYPTTLMQIAGSQSVVLIQLLRTPFSERLARLLSDPGVVKAGVAIREDMRRLRDLRDFEPAALVDLAEMAHGLCLRAQGLRTLAADLMGGRISKAAQCSNWGKKELTPQQIRYAATDAWIGREIYLRLDALSRAAESDELFCA